MSSNPPASPALEVVPSDATSSRASTPSRSSSTRTSTRASASASAGASSSSTPSPPRRTPSTTAPVRQCFICLLDSNETTPGTTWVNPCPCTLEAHEDCMLQWVAEMEASGNGAGRRARRKDGTNLRCPACKGAIQVFEPFDPLLWARDRIHRAYSRATPMILLTMVTHSTVVTSAAYGTWAVVSFAGGNRPVKWLFEREQLPVFQYWTKTYSKIWLMSLILPGLIINRAVPGIDTYLLLPVSAVYGMYQIAENNVPQWPPSPTWALTLMPCVSLCYSHIYYSFFGRFERKLNSALRGRHNETARVDEPPQDNQPQAPAQRQQRRDNQEQGQQGADEEGQGNIFGVGLAVLRLAGAALGVILGNPDDIVLEEDDQEPLEEGERRIEIDVGLDDEGRFQIEVNGEDGVEGAENAEEVRAVVDEIRAVVADDIQAIAAEQVDQDPVQAVEEQHGEAREDQAANAEAAAGLVVQWPPEAAVAPPAAAQAGQPRQRQVEGYTSSPFSDMVNATVTTLLLPQVSFVMGEVLRLTLPRSWVSRKSTPPTPGLLHQTWGRSLVGGCLFIVLRDALRLVLKYRRVQARKKRRVKNVERRPGGASGTQTAV